MQHAPSILILLITSPAQYSVSSTDNQAAHYYSPLTSSALGPNILLSTLFSNSLTLRSTPNVSDQVSHPNKTTGKFFSSVEIYDFSRLKPEIELKQEKN
jgi:hypothetical protein